ncbi:MAG: helix-turn-helix transcriptional regulator [Clostridia bacterium]|nr:helix-turn-helix transcriptional regulator [Clostridia bacterium]
MARTCANWRRQAGVTQEELSARLFCSKSAIGKWESGVRAMPNEVLEGYCREFGHSLLELVLPVPESGAATEDVVEILYRYIRCFNTNADRAEVEHLLAAQPNTSEGLPGREASVLPRSGEGGQNVRLQRPAA